MSIESRIARMKRQARLWSLAALGAVLCMAMAGGCSDGRGGASAVSTVDRPEADPEAVADAEVELELAYRAHEDMLRWQEAADEFENSEDYKFLKEVSYQSGNEETIEKTRRLLDPYHEQVSKAYGRAFDQIQKSLDAHPTPEAYALRVRLRMVLAAKLTEEDYQAIDKDIASGLEIDRRYVDLLDLRGRVVSLRESTAATIADDNG